MRAAGILILVTACYRPEVREGAPCSETSPCPSELVCSTGVCRFSAIDAGVGGDGSEPLDGTCVPWFADNDGDQHGDSASMMIACSQPANMVASDDDCDDGDPLRFPGSRELCDEIDNDCDGATSDICPLGCTVQQRPAPDDGHRYLFCSALTSQPNAQTLCAQEGYDLARVDGYAENTYIRAAADTLITTGTIYIGGTDAAKEGTWRWPGGDVFWIDPAVVADAYANWDADEPNNAYDDENCLNLRGDGLWNDDDCVTGRGFVCRR